MENKEEVFQEDDQQGGSSLSPIMGPKMGGNALASKVGGKRSRKSKRRGGSAVDLKSVGGRRSRKNRKTSRRSRSRK